MAWTSRTYVNSPSQENLKDIAKCVDCFVTASPASYGLTTDKRLNSRLSDPINFRLFHYTKNTKHLVLALDKTLHAPDESGVKDCYCVTLGISDSWTNNENTAEEIYDLVLEKLRKIKANESETKFALVWNSTKDRLSEELGNTALVDKVFWCMLRDNTVKLTPNVLDNEGNIIDDAVEKVDAFAHFTDCLHDLKRPLFLRFLKLDVGP